MATIASLRAGLEVRWFEAVICALLLAAPAAVATVWAAEGGQGSAEPAMLEAFILDRALRFLTWPEGSGAEAPESVLVVAVLGESLVGRRLREMVPKPDQPGHRLEVRAIERIQDAGDARMVLLSGAQEAALESVIAWLRGKPVLLVAEGKDLARRGAAIGLFPDGGRIHLQLNQAALREARISANYRLLTLAELVGEGGP